MPPWLRGDAGLSTGGTGGIGPSRPASGRTRHSHAELWISPWRPGSMPRSSAATLVPLFSIPPPAFQETVCMNDYRPAGSANDKILFWGCFIALVTTSFAFVGRMFLVNTWALE